MATAIFDIETDGLYEEATKVHCIALKVDDEPTQLFTDIDKAVEILNNADITVAHNGINFDIPTLEKLGYNLTSPTRDTLIMSRLAHPNISITDANRKTIPPKLKGRTVSRLGAIAFANSKVTSVRLPIGKHTPMKWVSIASWMLMLLMPCTINF